MYNNGHKTTFKTQKLYENRDSFNKAMKRLVKANFIRVASVKRENEYKLTLNGILCIEEVLRDIAPGETLSFEVTVFSLGPKISRVEVLVEARP